ncbi:MAG: hypothetical protein QXR93_06020 [Archaeoglobaceae archaeon]
MLLVLFSIVLKQVRKHKDRFLLLTDAQLRHLGETFSVSLEDLRESLDYLKKADVEQTGEFGLRITPFKKGEK